MKATHKRAAEIVKKLNASEREKAVVEASFMLLFWNEPAFKAVDFKAACKNAKSNLVQTPEDK